LESFSASSGTSRELPRTGENDIIKIEEDRGWPIDIRLACQPNYPVSRNFLSGVALTGRGRGRTCDVVTRRYRASGMMVVRNKRGTTA